MGLRGVWAGKRREAREELDGSGRIELPWLRDGLSRVDRVIVFLEWLPITKGKLEGQNMQLLPKQREFIRKVYGSKKRVRVAIKSEPRGNGKTGFLGGLCLCHLIGPESEPRGEVLSAGIDRQMAGIMFNEMEAMITARPVLQARVNIQRFHKRIEVTDPLDLDPPAEDEELEDQPHGGALKRSRAGEPGDLWDSGMGSVYEALSADARRAHGLAPTLWVYDELAQAKDRVLLDNLQTAMGKRKRSLGVIISTQAPSDDHPLSQIIDDGLSGADDSILVQLEAAPEDADPFDRKVIRSVNPAMGIFLDEADVMAEAERARRIPAFEAAFRNLRLNQRVDARSEDRVVPARVWKEGAVPVDVPKLEGRKGFGGLDLSGAEDLTALELVFPDDERERGYDILSHFWTPVDRLEMRAPAERDMFKLWIKQGLITAVPGPVIRMDYIVRELARLKETYDLVIGFDRWGMKRLTQEMGDAGLEMAMEPFGQGYADMTPAIQYFIELALTHRLRHGGHAVLTACVANAIVIGDAAGNRKFDKDKSNRRSTTRIDGAVALAMALGTAQRHLVQAPDLLAQFLSNPVSA